MYPFFKDPDHSDPNKIGSSDAILLVSKGDGKVTPLSINTNGGTEIPVFRRCVAGTIEHPVRIISIIKTSAAELCLKSRFSLLIKGTILIFPKTQILTINSRLPYTFFIIFHIAITISSNRMRQQLQKFSFSLKHKYCQFFCSSKKYL